MSSVDDKIRNEIERRHKSSNTNGKYTFPRTTPTLKPPNHGHSHSVAITSLDSKMIKRPVSGGRRVRSIGKKSISPDISHRN